MVENEVGDKGKVQITKDLESHIEEFSSYSQRRVGKWWRILSAGGVGVVVVWLGLQFNKSLLVCVENSVCGERGRLEPR